MADITVPQTLADRFGGIDSRVRRLEKQGVWFAIPNVGAGYQNGWSDFAGGYTGGAIRKIGDRVELRGLVQRSTNPVSAHAIFTLPAGWWPTYRMIFGCLISDLTVARVDILNTGAVNWNGGNGAGSAGFLTLDGIYFSVTNVSTLTI